jgi:hypothetical protein
VTVMIAFDPGAVARHVAMLHRLAADQKRGENGSKNSRKKTSINIWAALAMAGRNSFLSWPYIAAINLAPSPFAIEARRRANCFRHAAMRVRHRANLIDI